MKVKLLVLVFVLAGAFGSFAQEGGLALRGGVNLNSVGKSSHNLGFHLGATYDTYFGGVFGFETGLLLDTRGSKFKFLNNVAKSTFVGATIPVLGKVKLDLGSAELFLNAGPFAHVHMMGLQNAKNAKFGGEYGMKCLGYGLTFGGGVEIDNLIIGVGYDLGLSSFGKVVGVKFNTIKIGLGYRL